MVTALNRLRFSVAPGGKLWPFHFHFAMIDRPSAEEIIYILSAATFVGLVVPEKVTVSSVAIQA